MADVLIEGPKESNVHYQIVKLDNGNILVVVRIPGKKNPQGKPTTEIVRIDGFPELICETKPEALLTFKTVDEKEVQNRITFYDVDAMRYDKKAKKEVPSKTTPQFLERIKHNNVAMEMQPVGNANEGLNILLYDRTSIVSLEQMHTENLTSINENYKKRLEKAVEIVTNNINEIEQKTNSLSYKKNDDSIIVGDIVDADTSTSQKDAKLVFAKDVEFALTTQETESLPSKPVIKKFSEMSERAIKTRIQKIQEKFFLQGEDDIHTVELKKKLKQELLIFQRAIKARLEFIKKYALDENSSAKDIIDSLTKEIKLYSKNFKQNMAIFFTYYTFFEQRIMSFYAFFCESMADGNADSVFFINCSPVAGSGTKLFDEEAYIDLPKISELGNLRPIDASVDINGNKLPITLKSLEDVNILQDLPTIIVLLENFQGKKEIRRWATIAERSKSICIINVDPKYVGPDKPFDPSVDPVELREYFTDEKENFKSMVAVANAPIIRWPTKFENSSPLIFPAAPLAGKLYNNIKVDKERCMADSVSNPQNDQLFKEYMVGLSCPSLVNCNSVLKNINIIFIDTSSNKRADSIVIHFNSMCTLYSKRKYPLTLTLCKNFLDKLITHHMKSESGVSNSYAECQRVAMELNLKLASYSSRDKNSKPFSRAYIDQSVSQVMNEEDGTPYQYHEVNVDFNEVTELFKVKIK